MKKKLVVKFWKAERALAMQIVEQEGLPKEIDFDVSLKQFSDNEKRDEYLTKMTQAITYELFTGTGELKVGEICKVSDCEIEDGAPNELIAILPKEYKKRFIVKVFYDKGWEAFEYARPLCKRTEPKVEINGEIITYTWEEE